MGNKDIITLTVHKKNNSESNLLFFPPFIAIIAFIIIYFFDLNEPVFIFLNHLANNLFSIFWLHIDILGDWLILVTLFLLISMLFPRILLPILAVYLLSLILGFIFQPLYDMASPVEILDRSTFFILLEPEYMKTNFSSVKALSSFSFIGISIFLFVESIFIRALLLVFILIIGLSRIAIGLYWPTDVLGSFILAWISISVGRQIYREIDWVPSIIILKLFCFFNIILGIYMIFSAYSTSEYIFEFIWGIVVIIFSALLIRFSTKIIAHQKVYYKTYGN